MLQDIDNYCCFDFQGGEPTLAGLGFYKKLIELQDKYCIKKSKFTSNKRLYINDELEEFLANNNFLVGLCLGGFNAKQ